jgi:Na+-driven multidrug efflux pump
MEKNKIKNETTNSKLSETTKPKEVKAKKNVKLDGGWDGDKLIIPFLTKREYALRYQGVWSAIAYFCIPTVVLMLTQGLYNILDKTLALQFATPHATTNWSYITKLIIGDGTTSVLSDAMKDGTNNWNVFTDLFSVTGDAADLEKLKDLVNNFSSSTDLNKFFEDFKNIIHDNNLQVSIQSSHIREYINITTQYTMQTYNIAYAFSQIMAIGAGMNYAVQFGKSKREKLGEIAGNGISQSFIMSIIISTLLFLLSFPQLHQVLITSQMGGHKNEVIEALAWNDVEPLIFGLSTMFVAGVTMNMIRSEGKMIHVMIMTLTSILVKCSVAISAMYFGGLELAGAQLGTIMAFLYQIIYCLFVIFCSKVSFSKFKFRHLIILRRKNWAETLKAGVPNFIIYFAVVVNSYVSTATVISLPIPKEGPSFSENGGVSILQQLISSMTPWAEFILSVCIGLNQGVRTMIAYNYGAKRNKRIIDILKKSTWLMFGWFCFIFILVVAAGPSMMTLFAFPEEYAQYGNIFYWYQFLYFFTYPFASLTYIGLGIFQGTRKTNRATIVTSLRSMVVFLPMLGIGYGITMATGNAIWFFLFVGMSDLVSAIVIAPMLIAYYKKAKRENKLVNVEETLINQAIYQKTMYLKTKDDKYKDALGAIVTKIKSERK